MKYIIFLVVISSTVSCTKEEITNYYAYLKNKTTHQVEIIPYSNGMGVPANVIILTPDGEKQIANGFDRGIVGNAGFNSGVFSNVDSIQVTFDNIYTITHYINTPVNLYPKHYLYRSLRNIANYLSYIFKSEDVSKTKRINTYIFEFTEQDYLDAQ